MFRPLSNLVIDGQRRDLFLEDVRGALDDSRETNGGAGLRAGYNEGHERADRVPAWPVSEG